jgi:glycosyltransferase involved in cell wall biosynthesis
MRPRITFIDYFPPHYRQGLYEEIARETEADFYFFSDERERWQDSKIPAVWEGDYRRVDLRRFRIAGQAVLPGIVLALGAKRYDAVVKSLNGKLMLPLTFVTAKLRKVPFVLWTGMWFHPTTLTHRLSRPLTEAIYRRADAIVCYGEHVKRFVTQVSGVTSDKVFVAGQAVNSRPFESVSAIPADGVPEVVFIGQLKPYKGVTTLIDAWARLGSPAKLRIVGNGPLESTVRERAAGRDDVEMLGLVGQEELPAVLARARCLVLPSETTELDREPWGLVVNEAMHAGLPVVASDAVGAAAGGLVRDGQNGFVVPEANPDALAGALRRLVDDRELALKLGEAARRDVQAFNYERMAGAFRAAVEHAMLARNR